MQLMLLKMLLVTCDSEASGPQPLARANVAVNKLQPFIGANQLGIYATLATKSPFTEYLRRRPPEVAEETLAPPPRHAAELFFLCLFLVK